MIAALLKRAIPTLAAEKVGFRSDGLVHFVEGRRGRGKSYWMAQAAYAAFSRRVPVLANYTINVPLVSTLLALDGVFSKPAEASDWLHSGGYRQIRAWDDVFSAIDCEVHIDESQQYVNTRAFRDTPAQFLEWLRQSRKVGVTSRFGSQSFEFVDVQVRRVVDILWLARLERQPKASRPAGFYYYGIDPWYAGFTESVVRDRADFLMRLPFDVLRARIYSTIELINPPAGLVSFESVSAAYRDRRSNRAGRIFY